jgi:hypothetical protein
MTQKSYAFAPTDAIRVLPKRFHTLFAKRAEDNKVRHLLSDADAVAEAERFALRAKRIEDSKRAEAALQLPMFDAPLPKMGAGMADVGTRRGSK